MLWECLGHCSELLQIKWDLRIECGNASEIDQTVNYKPEMVLKWLVGILIHECKSMQKCHLAGYFNVIHCIHVDSPYIGRVGSEVSGSLPLPPAGTSLYQI